MTYKFRDHDGGGDQVVSQFLDAGKECAGLVARANVLDEETGVDQNFSGFHSCWAFSMS